MDREELQREIAQVIRGAEIRAVADVIRAGGRPALGQSIEYRIDTLAGVHAKRARPYRLEIEQWHLDAAEELVRANVGGFARGDQRIA